MLSREASHNIVGIIGNVISFCLFLSPLPTFFRIWKTKDVEEFQPYPYVATVLNCMFWIFYGLPIVKPDSILVTTINAIGLAIELIYLSVFCFYDKKEKTRVGLLLILETVFVAIIVVITLLCFHTHKGRTTFVGVFCVVFNVMMYASPLGIMRKVITTKSVEYMPIYLSLANALNGSIWTAYALIKFDGFMLTSNGLGAISGVAQLVVYACFYHTTPRNNDSTGAAKPSEIELQE